MNVELILMSSDIYLYESFENHFVSFSNQARLHMGYFEDLDEYDCLVSPANSFGVMDGGMDLAIIEYFGKELEENVQNHILSHYAGEQPVGTCFITETFNHNHPFLAHTPTMRTPQDIRGTLNPYYAMKAMLSAVINHNKTHIHQIHSVAIPGLGTGTGMIDVDLAVKQMALAYRHVLETPKKTNPHFAYQREQEILSLLYPYR